MDKFLYFAQADGANATAEAALYPLSAFLGFDPLSATTLQMNFASSDPKLGGTTAVYYDEVVMTITSNTHKKVMNDIVRAINAPGIGNKDGFIVICDHDNSVFASSDINSSTACVITIGAAS